MKAHTISVIFKAKPDKISAMKKVIKEVYLPSLSEKGMQEYRWYQSPQKPNEFLLFMTWDNEQAFQAHAKSKPILDAEQVLKNILIAEAPELYWEYIPTEEKN